MGKKVSDDVPAALDRLGFLRAQITQANDEKAKAVNKLLEPHKAKVKAIEQRNKQIIDGIKEEMEPLEAKIKLAVIDEAQTIRGGEIGEDGKVQGGQYNRPRRTVNITKLEGYAASHPEVLAFIEEDEQGSCSIVRLKPE